MIRHLFILNPQAGGKNPVEKATESIKKAFILNTDKENETYDILLTKKKGDAAEFARQAAAENPGFTRIYACGGDGTLHEVVNGAVGAENVAICPVPVGSGNDFIRYFDDIPKEKFLDVSSCLRGKDHPCDVMRCGDVYSINNISVGLDAITAKRQQKIKRLPLLNGEAAYTAALGYSFFFSMKTPLHFEIDGEELFLPGGNATLAVMSNGKFYGGGYKATPFASIDDGLIDFVTLPTINRLEFLQYVPLYKKGEHIGKIPQLEYRRCKKIKLFSPKPLCLQADGEIFEMRDPEIEICPKAIRLVLPE